MGALKNRKGFTLVEVLIALAVSTVVLGAVYSLYTYFLRTSARQDRLIEIQQEGRAALERITRDVRAAGCSYKSTPIITATDTEFEFESDIDPDPLAGPWKISYGLDAVNNMLTRSEAAWTGAAYGSYSAAQEVAAHVSGVVYTYYDENGSEISTPIDSQANRDLIRRIDVTLTTQSDVVNPATNTYDEVNFTTSLNLRCMGVEQSSDTTSCNLPTNMASADLGATQCGSLNVTWTKSSSSDAAGYKLYYRPTGTSSYTGVLTVSGGATESYAVTGLENGVQYDIALKCYDTAGNLTDTAQGPITGTGGSIDTKPDDSTAPSAPSALSTTSGDTYVDLLWTQSASADVGGYNIYRSDDGGTIYTKIGEVDSNYSTYSDATVANCPNPNYYYYVTTWDCAANESSPSSPATAYPEETTAPSDPTSFSAVAGADKIYLSHTTPSDADLSGVRILRRTDQYPTGPDDATAIGPNTVKDYEPLNASQTYSLTDSNSVAIGTTYYYRAFAYDACANYSAGTISQATAQPCGDGEVGSEHYGSPAAPSAITPSVCSVASLAWSAPSGSANGNPFDPATENDVVGYFIYRGTAPGGPYTKLNASPVTSESYSDADVTPGTSNHYYYTVSAVDCADKESSTSAETEVVPTDLAWDTNVDVTTYGTSGASGSQHNIVKFGIKNSGDTPIVINSAVISWSNATAYLKKATLKRLLTDSTATTLWDDSALPFTSSGGTVDFTGTAASSLRTVAQASSSEQNEFTIEFKDSANNATVDMRSATITLTVSYTNVGSGASCASSTFTITVPLGPVIAGSTQNRPADPTTSNLNYGVVTVPYGSQDAVTYAWTAYTVKVSSSISEDAGATLSSAVLYYKDASKSTTTAPATDYSSSPSGWTAITMCRVYTDSCATATSVYQTADNGCGCTASEIANKVGKRVWYYIKATDSKTNYDIQPEPNVGMYTYDQDSRFKFTMYTGRFSSYWVWGGNGKYVRVWTYVTDENNAAVTGLGGGRQTVTITGEPSTNTETGNMIEYSATGSPGWYYYDAVNTYTDNEVDVEVTATKTYFTASKCGQQNVQKNLSTWDVDSCN